MSRLPQSKRSLRAVGVVVGALAAAEVVSWAASYCLLGEVDNAVAVPRGEAVVVLGHADPGPIAGRDNRQRVRAGLRSRRLPDSRLIFSGGAVAGPVPEAELMARYATDRLGYAGPLDLETTSRSTWENIAAVIPMIEDADRIIIVSEPVHALKARLFLRRQRPDLAARLARARDYRAGEYLLHKPAVVALGLVDLGLSVWVPGWARNSATGLAGVRRLLAGVQPKRARKSPRRSNPSVISSRAAA
ncbi:YdcF family protein [Actinomyces glycerinitolerans]|uniref:DUF218 domain-containing protein n=1 Tax=Actinomyces glycerinitolerans TaxID=1892869 RepID=A0A1M4S173_9ACTO|nr:YdcF family protein [Actinomyces glycerinitolerans]SHE25986.1 Hypothetical protein ACGLYG10_2225 [Actinomyces glycerinitolerans]